MDDAWSSVAKVDAVEELIDLAPTTFISAMTGVSPIPSNLANYQSALMQQTNNSVNSKSLLDIQWAEGMFNGMLFKVRDTGCWMKMEGLPTL